MNKTNKNEIKEKYNDSKIPLQFGFLFPNKNSNTIIKAEKTLYKKFTYQVENKNDLSLTQVNNIIQRIDFENQIKHLNGLNKSLNNKDKQSNFSIIYHNYSKKIDCKDYFDNKRYSLYLNANAVNMYFNIKDLYVPQKNLFNEYRIQKIMELSEGDKRIFMIYY